MLELNELVAVVAVEAEVGAKPHEPSAVLEDRKDIVLREPVLD